MTYIRAFLAAFSAYSIIPVPQFEWDEDVTRRAICFFPFVGLVCGGVVWAWCSLAKVLGVGAVFFAAIAVSLPVLLTGGIHLDGFMDTVDALASHQSRERRLEIMKDPNCGAFSVIYCGVYLLVTFGLFHELFIMEKAEFAGMVFVLSRILSALCAVTMPNARKSGMLSAFTQNVSRREAAIWLCLLLLIFVGVMLLFSPFAVAMMLLTAMIYRKTTLRLFGGVTGDTAGFLLCLAELAGLFGIWLGVEFF